jgi:chaperonin cofactor prefoldin
MWARITDFFIHAALKEFHRELEEQIEKVEDDIQALLEQNAQATSRLHDSHARIHSRLDAIQRACKVCQAHIQGVEYVFPSSE